MGALQEETEVVRVPLLCLFHPRSSPGRQGDGEPGGCIQGVGEGEGVDGIGVEGGGDDGRFHCGGLHAAAMEDEGLGTQLRSNCRKERDFII